MTSFDAPWTLAIARIWRGRTRREIADEYERSNYEEGIKPLIEKASAVQSFRLDHENETAYPMRLSARLALAPALTVFRPQSSVFRNLSSVLCPLSSGPGTLPASVISTLIEE